MKTYDPDCVNSRGHTLDAPFPKRKLRLRRIFPPSVTAVHPDRDCACLMTITPLSGNAFARLRVAVLSFSSVRIASGDRSIAATPAVNSHAGSGIAPPTAATSNLKKAGSIIATVSALIASVRP